MPADKPNPELCFLCDKRMKQCPHPWHFPFEKWPSHMRQRLREIVREGSGEK